MFEFMERGAQMVSANQQSNCSLDVLPYVNHENLKSILPVGVPSFEGVTVQSVTWSVLNVWTISKVLLCLIIAANLKSFPLVYHLRLLNAFRFILKCQRVGQKDPTPSQLFQPIIMSSRNSLSETDMYMHKSNSSYFSDNDVARTHLVCTLFSKGIEKIRGGTSALVDGKASPFAMALGAVSCSFREEIKPYEQYEMWTRVLTWDEKWFYIVTHFVRKDAAEPTGISLYPSQRTRGRRKSSLSHGPQGSEDKKRPVIHASALSKCVFKKGRITIAPQVMLEACGLLPPSSENAVASGGDSPDPTLEVLSDSGTHQVRLHDVESLNPSSGAEVQSTQFVELDGRQRVADMSTESFPEDSPEGPRRRASADWTLHAIEAERLRGLEIAKGLAKQEALENHFNSDTNALGRHSDGTGITGIVTTLAQLGRLSNTQFL